MVSEQGEQASKNRFLSPEEENLGSSLLDQGWVQQPVEAPEELARIRDRAAHFAAEHLDLSPGVALGRNPGAFLSHIGNQVTVPELNNLRLAVFRRLNSEPWFRPAYFRLARHALFNLVGNELAMQRRVNLSIQLPGDDSSLLPLHADSWSGDSPYEIVVWVPLVDCQRTQSMFLLPRPSQERLLGNNPDATRTGGLQEAGNEGAGHNPVAEANSVEALFRLVEPEVQFLEASYGEVILFDQNLLHGNRVNEESTTRWSLNCRFKGLFTPYADKKLGEFFEPITVRPMSQIGMAHRFPQGFDDQG